MVSEQARWGQTRPVTCQIWQLSPDHPLAAKMLAVMARLHLKQVYTSCFGLLKSACTEIGSEPLPNRLLPITGGDDVRLYLLVRGVGSQARCCERGKTAAAAHVLATIGSTVT